MSKIESLTIADARGLELEFADAIHAGFPSPAAEHAGERIDIVKELNRHPDTTFYAMVSGDSMRDAGLLDGDIIVIDKSLEPHNGDFIVAAIDGEFTLKEFQYHPGDQCAWLVPHNPDFEKICVTAENNFSVWGVVTHSIHKTRR
ncbi:MAG: translesion error-prone DNA polymerase V autoproteolytic subunit [Paludibacteraceae bacterium]|nr:translesion error-prone DNA polymerase V autoproteolytic subunit [Paludibacteraceae bacterium]